MLTIGALLFDKFELLDVYGPLEMFGMLPEHFLIHMVAENDKQVQSAQGPQAVIDDTFDLEKIYDIILIPGGQGTRSQIDNPVLLNWIQEQNSKAKFVTSVCTGSALLAKSGILDNKKATTNKRAFDWVKSHNEKVDWIAEARWVEDGKFFTSSGVSAGMDMSLGLIRHILGHEIANQVAQWAEYEWHSDSSWDPFAKINNLV